MQTERKEHSVIWPVGRVLDFDGVPAEGWVAGVPVVNGVADSGWLECGKGRLRVKMLVQQNLRQRDLVRSLVFGDGI